MVAKKKQHYGEEKLLDILQGVEPILARFIKNSLAGSKDEAVFVKKTLAEIRAALAQETKGKPTASTEIEWFR